MAQPELLTGEIRDLALRTTVTARIGTGRLITIAAWYRRTWGAPAVRWRSPQDADPMSARRVLHAKNRTICVQSNWKCMVRLHPHISICTRLAPAPALQLLICMQNRWIILAAPWYHLPSAVAPRHPKKDQKDRPGISDFPHKREKSKLSLLI